jgi:hypothetical protein
MKLRNWAGIGAVLLIVVLACNKDGIATKPSLKLKSVSTDFVPLNGSLQFVFEFSDKEGDITLPLGLEKISSTCPDASYIDTVKFGFPDIPGTKNTDGTLEVNLNNINILPIRCHGQDTVELAVFKFWIRDDAGNVSDTVTTEPITIVK